MSYFNTTSETGDQLNLFVKKSNSQDEKILDFFKCHKNTLFTPFDIHKRLFDNNTPIQSVRRSITTLEKTGFIQKTDIKKQGDYGRSNYCWILKERSCGVE